MPQRLNLTALLVDEYDTAISFFVGKLGFDLREDTALTDGKRWVVVAPHGAANGLLLARAVGDRQCEAIGDQSGGRVFLFLGTDDFARDHLAYTPGVSASLRHLAKNHMASSVCSKTSMATDGI